MRRQLLTFWQAYRRTMGFDFALLRQYPRFALALIPIVLVPMLYASIYLSSMWDPASHTRELKVALVNRDQGLLFHDVQVNLGDRVIKSLKEQPAFNYVTYDNDDAAKAAVRQGSMTFALLIPPNFSAKALPGEQVGAAKLVVYVSEGNNYVGATFARRFAPQLSRKMNQTLNEERWRIVLNTATGAKEQLSELRDAVTQLQTGAKELATATQQAHQGSRQLDGGLRQLAGGSGQLGQGLKQLQGASAQLTDGMKKAGDALRTMNSRLPADAELKALKDGAQQLSTGQQQFGQSLKQLQQGAVQLQAGTDQLAEGAEQLPFGGQQVVDAARQLGRGAGQLQAGLGDANKASSQLTQGAHQLSDGVARLTDGVGQLGGGISQLARALPPDAQLDQFSAGMRTAQDTSAKLDGGAKQLQQGASQLDQGLAKIAQGNERLGAGLALLSAKLPTDLASLSGSASGLSESIQPDLQVVSRVANQGVGYIPNFAPLALWVGATLCSFLFAYRLLPRSVADAPHGSVVLGKLTLPGLLVIAQTLVLTGVLVGVMGTEVLNLPRFLITMLLTASAFLALIFALVVVLGDAGRLMALVLLVLQLASAGATMPVELSTPFFQAIHPYMPFTWVVRAMRVAMFGAYDGEWTNAIGIIVLIDIACVAIAVWLGRWRVVDDAQYKPSIDL